MTAGNSQLSRDVSESTAGRVGEEVGSRVLEREQWQHDEDQLVQDYIRVSPGGTPTQEQQHES